MWSAALVLLKSLLDAFNSHRVSKERANDRKAGADAATVESQAEVIERVKVSNGIDDADLPDGLLIHPSKRKAGDK